MSDTIGHQSVSTESVELSVFNDFIVNISTCLFEADEQAFSESLNMPQNSELIKKFIIDPQQPVLFIQKTLNDVDGLHQG